MHAELEGVGQAEFADGEGNDAEVLVELFLELREVPDVIDPFVESSGEFWGDRLDRYAFLGRSSPGSGTAPQGFAARRSRLLRLR